MWRFESCPGGLDATKMILYPILLNLRGERCLIIGGGEVARRKVEHLLEAGARVRVIAPRAGADFARWKKEGRIEWVRAAYRADMLEEEARLVFACTNDAAANRKIAEDARARKISVNCADDPARGDFHVPSMVRRGDFLMTVSTGGQAPALAREICHRLEQQFGPAWADFTGLLGDLRRKWKTRGESARIHSRMLEILASDTFEVMQSQGMKAARHRVARLLREKHAAGRRTPGHPSSARRARD